MNLEELQSFYDFTDRIVLVTEEQSTPSTHDLVIKTTWKSYNQENHPNILHEWRTL